MSLRIYGATSGYVDLDAPAVAGSASVTLPGSGTLATQAYADGLAGLTLITTQTFSAASSVSVNNCFSATYANYRVVINATASSDGLPIRFRMRSAGSDYTASQHFSFGAGYDSGSAASNISDAGQSSWLLGYAIYLNTGTIVMNFCDPSTTGRKDAVGYVAGANSGGTSYAARVTGWAINASVTAPDGFTFYVASGSLTGAVRVYGYKN